MDSESTVIRINPSYAIHTAYDADNIPPKLSNTSVRFVCISDNHGSTFPIPCGDVLLHAGDLTDLGRLEEIERVMGWICELPHQVKVLIGGNHDLPLDTKTYEDNWKNLLMGPLEDPITFRYLLTGKKAKEAGVLYVEHSLGTFNVKGREWTVFGSPSSPGQPGSAFTYPRNDASSAKYDEIPQNMDIVLTHTPPHNTLDEIEWRNRRAHAGCTFLEKVIQRVRPRLHVFGHIHQSRGVLVKAWEDEYTDGSDNPSGSVGRETIFVNASTQATGKGIKGIQEDLGAFKSPELYYGQYWFQPIIIDLEL